MRGYNVRVNGKSFFVEIEEAGEGQRIVPLAEPRAIEKPAVVQEVKKNSAPAGGQKVVAPLPGLVLKVCVQSGAAVKKGDKLLVLEAMKMEHEIFAPVNGTVTILVKQGDSVSTEADMAVIG